MELRGRKIWDHVIIKHSTPNLTTCTLVQTYLCSKHISHCMLAKLSRRCEIGDSSSPGKQDIDTLIDACVTSIIRDYISHKWHCHCSICKRNRCVPQTLNTIISRNYASSSIPTCKRKQCSLLYSYCSE